MFILRNLKIFWLIVLCMLVFNFSGCGGSADSSSSDNNSNDNNTNTEIPNNTPETYNTAYVLDGDWLLIDQEILIDDIVYTNDASLTMYLVEASINFSDTEIFDERGISSVDFHESWRIFANADERIYLGIQSFDISEQHMNMSKSGADNWRCEFYYDTYKNVMNINIIQENMITITEHRAVSLNNVVFVYDNVMTFKKKVN